MGKLDKDRYRKRRFYRTKHWIKRIMNKYASMPATDGPFQFRTHDVTLSFTSPYRMVEDHEPLPEGQIMNVTHLERYLSDPAIDPFKVGMVYMIFEKGQNQNIDVAVSETLQMYSEFFPDARIDYKVAHLYEFEGVEGFMLMGTISGEEDLALAHEFKHLYMMSENRFWNLNVLYDLHYPHGSITALQLLNSIDFDIELPYVALDNIWEAEWSRFTMGDGIFSFEAPYALTALSMPEVEGVLASATYGQETLYNFNIHCGYQSAERENITVEETLEQLKDLYVRDYKLKESDFTEEVMPEFTVPNKMVSGTITEYRTRWVFRGLIFALGNNVWFLQLRYQTNMEEGEAVYRRVRESIRFDESALEDVINDWLDKKH